MNADIQRKALMGSAVACVLACALALAVAPSQAFATYLPDGSGEFDVSVLTNVLPTQDPDAALNDVLVHVSNDAGEHLENAQVTVAIVPPNANGYDPAAAEADVLAVAGPSHSVGVSSITNAGGHVTLAQAAVGATYRVTATKDGHVDFEDTFLCVGDNNETWEVVLQRIPDPAPPTPGPSPTPPTPDSNPASLPSADGEQGSSQVIKPLPWLLATGDAALPLALGSLALLVAAGIVVLWSRRAGEEDGRHDG